MRGLSDEATRCATLTPVSIREGYGSVAEMRAKQEELKGKAIDSTQSTRKASAEAHHSGMTEADAKVAAEIRRRAEAEAERKIKSGNFTSGPGIKVRLDERGVQYIGCGSHASLCAASHSLTSLTLADWRVTRPPRSASSGHNTIHSRTRFLLSFRQSSMQRWFRRLVGILNFSSLCQGPLLGRWKGIRPRRPT